MRNTMTNYTEPVADDCPFCGSGPIREVRRTVTKRAGTDSPIEMTEELSRCAACGEHFFTPAQSMAQSRAYADAVRDADRLISPDRIRAARVALDMSQAAFENALGVGRKTVVRWEKGTVPPSPTANGMLWLAERYPSVFLEYASEREAKHEIPETITSGKIIATISSTSQHSGKPLVFKPDTTQTFSKRVKSRTQADLAARALS
jgi:HTH-type transcriptional regulator/antitoxin MqsA